MHRQGIYEKYFKRIQDIVCSLAAIVLLSPVMAALAVLIRIKLGVPVIFSQERPGLNGKIFKLYKFRSMTDEKDEKGELLPDAARLTTFGKKLRASSLDELPELFNILKGDMSMVGPRPLLVKYIPLYSEEQARRHEVRPGVTGLAQVHGRNRITWEERFCWDVKYVNRISFLGDWRIIFRTVKTVLSRQGIDSGTSATMEDFKGTALGQVGRRPKLLILANDSTGLFKFRKELIERLMDHNWKVYVSLPEGIFIDHIKKMGCSVIINRYLERRGTSISKDLCLLRYYIRLQEEIQPDMVFTYTIKPNVYGGTASAFLGIPYIANVTGLGTTIENRGILRFIAVSAYRLGLRKAEKVFFQNKDNQAYMLRHHIVKQEKCGLLPGSGVNIDEHRYEPYPKAEGPVIFTVLGRIMRDKGIHEILEAAGQIKRKYPHTVFRLVGDFDESYEGIVRKYERRNIVTYIPQQPDVHPFIAESHAVLHASYHEGMSNVLLEAAATGRPVIATDVHGCIETFEPGVTGIAFRAGSTSSLISAVEKFLAMSHEERVAMGKAGRIKMEKEFNRRIVVDKYMAEAKKILAQ